MMSLVTTEPAPMTTSSTMRTGMIVALDPVADDGLAPKLLFAVCRRPGRKRVVDEHHAMADEAILPDRHQFADEGMRLHAGARADDGPLLDLGEGTDEAIVADPAFIEVAGLDDLDPHAERDVA